jgi:hypothetical protein
MPVVGGHIPPPRKFRLLSHACYGEQTSAHPPAHATALIEKEAEST